MIKGSVCLISAICIHFCIGGIYGWSTFVPALCANYQLTITQTQIVFGTVFGVFTTTTLLAGKLQNIIGPRWVTAIGGVLFSAGYLLAAFSECSFYELLIFIGVLSGLGTGFCYVVPLTTVIKWFPNRKGLATGLVVAGFGSGAIFLSNAAEMLSGRGIHIHNIFLYISLCYGFVILTAAQFIINPNTQSRLLHTACTSEIRIAKLFRDKRFIIMLAGMFGGTFAGMLIIGNMKPIGLSLGMNNVTAMLGISAFAFGNGTGRILWGLLFDKFGAKTIAWSLSTLTIGCLILLFSYNSIIFLAAGMIAGFGFGACFVIYAAQIATEYGTSNVGGIYPIVFIFYGLSGVAAPLFGGYIMDSTSSYMISFVVCSVLLLAILSLTRVLQRQLNTSDSRSG
ncbi:MAG: MFS transporter [Sedimentisphaerales bacterium]